MKSDSGCPFIGSPVAIGGPEDPSKSVVMNEQLKQALFHAHKAQMVGALTTGIAHDFNNVFAAILLQLDLVSEYQNLPDQGKEDLENAKASASRGAELVKRLLAFARPAPGGKRLLDSGAMTQEFVALLRRCITRRIQITLTTSPELWPTHGDENHIILVLVNFCLNARDAMASGGEIKIELSNATLPPDQVKMPGHGTDFIRFAVTDTGAGMTPEVFGHLFEPYFTTKEQGRGAGLGLSISCAVARDHGGWIEAQTTVGRGSCFQLLLPRALPSPADQLSHHHKDGSLEGTETILVADPDAMSRSLLVAILSFRGYKTLEVSEPTAALQKISNKAEAIHLAILDLKLPHLDLVIESIHIDRQLPILLCGETVEIESLAQAGKLSSCIGTLPKPLVKLDLLRQVRRCCDAKR